MSSNTYYHIPRTEESRIFFANNEKFTTRENVFGATFIEILSYHVLIDLDKGKGKQGLINALSNDREALIQKYPNLIDSLFDVIIRTNRRYTEFIFEQIRTGMFPNFPSRFNCMYLCEKDSVENWYNSMILRCGISELPIYKFEVTGKVHKADQRWLDQDVLAHGNYVQAGQKYWSGELFDTINPPMYEILFSGRVKRVEKYENIEDFKKKY